MNQFKVIWNNDGKHNSNSVTVSAREAISCGLTDIISPTDIKGAGSCFGSALEDFSEQLSEYIEELQKFRSEVVETSRAYTEAIETDFAGNPLRGV